MSAAITKRVDLNTGYSCNERCQFCYYQNTLEVKDTKKDLTTGEAKHWLDYIRRRGKTIVDLTGGEPTIRKDFLELVAYAREIGFEEICVITNGIRFADPRFAEAAIKAGVNDVLLSIHGHDAASHDNQTQRRGSFARVIKALDNVRALGVRRRTNTVVTGLNVHQLAQTAELLVNHGVKTVNFILFNPIVEADSKKTHMNVAYSEAAPRLKEVIERFGPEIDRLTVRYIPLCLMQGYEAYVTNMPQLQYDPDEWDYLIRTRIREGWPITFAALCLGLGLLPDRGRALKVGWQTTKRDGIKRFLQLKNRIKGKACRRCRYDRICDGLWREYAKWRGFDELSAVPGTTVSDPLHFRPDGISPTPG